MDDYAIMEVGPSRPAFVLETPGTIAIAELAGKSALTIVHTSVTKIEHPESVVQQYAEPKRGGDMPLSVLTILAPEAPIYGRSKLANIMTMLGKEMSKVEQMGSFTLEQSLSYSPLRKQLAPVLSAGDETIGKVTTTQSFVPFEGVNLPEQSADWHGGKAYLTHHLALYPDNDMARLATRKVDTTVKINGEFFKPARIALARA